MAFVTAQQLSQYYEEFQNTEIAFTKSIIQTLNMDPRQIYVKCNGSQWPCIINSTSFLNAKIIIGTKGGAFQQLAQKNAPPVSLRFCFYKSDGTVISFFVSGRITAISSYMNSHDLAILTVQYTQRPPDDLIEMIGHLLEANANAVRRKDERIPMNQETRRLLGISKDECEIVIQNVPRHCILRDLSFSGAKVLLLGLAQFLVNKEIQLSIQFEDPHEVITLKGVILNATPIEGRKDIFAVGIKFDEASVSLSYKIHINSYITSVRKNELDRQDRIAAQLAQQKKLKELEELKARQAQEAAQKSQESSSEPSQEPSAAPQPAAQNSPSQAQTPTSAAELVGMDLDTL